MADIFVTPGTSPEFARHLNAKSHLPKIANLTAQHPVHMGVDWTLWRQVRANMLGGLPQPKLPNLGPGLGTNVDILI